jgi:3-isopropylmalate/(R)-2-methylmalate dehydratase small subunit
LFKESEAAPGYRLAIDLDQQTISTPGGEHFSFEIDAFRKHCLKNGLDEIGLTLEHAERIKIFEDARRLQRPWLFN